MKSGGLLVLIGILNFQIALSQPLSPFKPLVEPFPVPEILVYDSANICDQYYWTMAEVGILPWIGRYGFGNVFGVWEPGEKTPAWFYWAENSEKSLNDLADGERWVFVADGKFHPGNFISLSIASEIKQSGASIPEWDGYTMLDESFDYSWGFPGSAANLNPITFPDSHDFQFNSQTGEWTYIVKKLEVLDISPLSGNPLDTAVTVVGDEIQIHADTGLVFRWSVLDSIDIREVSYDFAQFSSNYTGGILNATHANSVRWALDGNLLISLRGVGCMKIDRHTGEILWRLGSFFPGAARIIDFDTAYQPIWQHDFAQINHGPFYGMYSVYSNGNLQTSAKAIIFDINEQNLTATVEFHKELGYFSLALGSLVLPLSGGKIINWGHSIQQIYNADSTVVVEHLDDNDDPMLEILFPRNVFPYYVDCTENKVLRPQFDFYFSADSVILRAVDPEESKWYSVNDSLISFNDSITVSVYDTSFYYMQQRVGIGIGVSEMVSPSTLLLPVNAYELNFKEQKISPYPNPVMRGQRLMDIPENAALMDVLGQKALLPKNGLVPTNLPQGVYFLLNADSPDRQLLKIMVY